MQKSYLHNYPILLCFFAWILILNASSCGCGSDVLSNVTHLKMEVTPSELIGDQKITSLTFLLEKPDEIVHLEKFRLKISSKKQEQGVGSMLHYVDANNQAQDVQEIVEKLTHFTVLTDLRSHHPSFTVDLQVVPGKDVNVLVYQVDLTDSQDKVVGSATFTWYAQKALVLTQNSPSKMEGNDKKIQLKIKNPNHGSTEKGKLKLLITRTSGREAVIREAATTKDNNTYELALSSIPGNQKIARTLVIDPKRDAQASFNIQLYYQGRPQGEMASVNWEQGMLCAMKAVGNPRTLSCQINNQSTIAARNVKLQYCIKTPNILLQGKVIPSNEWLEKAVGRLDRDKRITLSDLGKLDFNGQKKIDIAYRLVYEVLEDEKEGVAIPQKRMTNEEWDTFFPADIHLKINELCQEDGQVVYTLQNTGSEVAEEVELYYENKGAANDLGDKKEQEIEKVTFKTNTRGKFTLAPGMSTERQFLPIHFSKADAVVYHFGIVYKGQILQPIRKETFRAKEVLIKLVTDKGDDHLTLVGANKKVHLKIETILGGRLGDNIRAEDISIRISKNEKGFLSLDGKKPSPDSLKVKGINKETILFLCPEKTEKSASFDLQLYYGKEEKGAPFRLVWQEDHIEIKDFNLFVGSNAASFTLQNEAGPMVSAAYNIVLRTNEPGIEFKLSHTRQGSSIKKSDSWFSKSATPAQDGYYMTDKKSLADLINQPTVEKFHYTAPIYVQGFRAPDKLKEAKVLLSIEREGIVLAQKEVSWREEGISLETGFSKSQLQNDEKLDISIINRGREVAMQDIIVELESAAGMQLQLDDKKYSSKIKVALDQVVQKDSRQIGVIQGGTKLSFQLAVIPPKSPQAYMDTVKLKIYRKGHAEEMLSSADFTWINKERVEKTINQYKEQFTSLKDSIQAQYPQILGHENLDDESIRDRLGIFHNFIEQLENIVGQAKKEQSKIADSLQVEGASITALIEEITGFIDQENNHIIETIQHLCEQSKVDHNAMIELEQVSFHSTPLLQQIINQTPRITPHMMGTQVTSRLASGANTPQYDASVSSTPILHVDDGRIPTMSNSQSSQNNDIHHTRMEPLNLSIGEDKQEHIDFNPSHADDARGFRSLFTSPLVDAAAKNNRSMVDDDDSFEEISIEDPMSQREQEERKAKIDKMLNLVRAIPSFEKGIIDRNNLLNHVRNSLVDIPTMESVELDLQNAYRQNDVTLQQLKGLEDNLLSALLELCYQELRSPNSTLKNMKQHSLELKKYFEQDQDTLMLKMSKNHEAYISLFSKANAYFCKFELLKSMIVQMQDSKMEMMGLGLDSMILSIEDLLKQNREPILELADTLIKGIEKDVKNMNQYSIKDAQNGQANIINVYQQVNAFYKMINDDERSKHGQKIYETFCEGIIKQAIGKSPQPTPLKNRS